MGKYKDIYKLDLKENTWMGIIVDTKDPLKQGRVKVRVFGVFDERVKKDENYPDVNLTSEEYLIETNFKLPNESLPWIHQKNSNVFAGGESKGFGSFSYPKLGTIVRVSFINGDVYSGEYDIVLLPNKTMLSKIKSDEDYEGSQVILFDEDEDLWLLYTRTVGFQIFHKGSQIVIRPDSSIFIEHKDSTSMMELKGSDIKIISNRDIDITSDNKITVNSEIVHINGANTYIGENPSFSMVNGEPLMKVLKALALMIDAKLSPTPGIATATVDASEKLILSSSVKTSK